jgi:hypothetical protein
MVFRCPPSGPGLFWSVLRSVIFWHQMRTVARDSHSGCGVESGSDAGQICRKQTRVVVQRRRR